MFGDVDYDAAQRYAFAPLEEQFEALVKARDAGKILEFGVSNETPWGLMRFCEIGKLLLASGYLQTTEPIIHERRTCIKKVRISLKVIESLSLQYRL